MKMSPIKQVLAGTGGAVAVALLGAGMFGAQDATAGIANTKHNLGATSGTNNRVTGGNSNGEICVFCHTPHGADSTAAVPLWNRKLGAVGEGVSYTTYASLGTSTLDASTAVVGSVSIACLSCHDGTQAMNAVINQPGSDGYNANGESMGGTWSGDNVNSDGTLKSNIITNIGVDLRNDHPVGIQYAGGFKATTGTGGISALPNANGGTYSKANFADPDFNDARIATLNGSTVWWVDTGAEGTGTRQKTDMLLYTRENPTMAKGVTDALSGVQPYVECASCHDPHVERATFLRILNTGSAVCLACHIK